MALDDDENSDRHEEAFSQMVTVLHPIIQDVLADMESSGKLNEMIGPEEHFDARVLLCAALLEDGAGRTPLDNRIIDTFDRVASEKARLLGSEHHWTADPPEPKDFYESSECRTFTVCAIEARLYTYLAHHINREIVLAKKGRSYLDYVLNPTEPVSTSQMDKHWEWRAGLSKGFWRSIVELLLDHGADPNLIIESSGREESLNRWTVGDIVDILALPELP
ncbi:hypothetical protein B0H66DRAFT_607314 [Apodospora peruviana]|uniref:Ankyrin repeat protein n=1 Tax=Apodospora peruviana TaxID=516989 RepID=A0AAE0LZW3_9PEZI|nr:hypothetical protein B0H66DRAFT_607314 [Apodospora peruviana]